MTILNRMKDRNKLRSYGFGVNRFAIFRVLNFLSPSPRALSSKTIFRETVNTDNVSTDDSHFHFHFCTDNVSTDDFHFHFCFIALMRELNRETALSREQMREGLFLNVSVEFAKHYPNQIQTNELSFLLSIFYLLVMQIFLSLQKAFEGNGSFLLTTLFKFIKVEICDE